LFEQEFYLEIRIKTEIWEEVVLYIMLLVSVDITYMCLKTWFLLTTNHKRYKEILNTEYSLKKYSLHCILNSPQPFHPACKAETEIQEEKDGSQTDRKRTKDSSLPFVLFLSFFYQLAIILRSYPFSVYSFGEQLVCAKDLSVQFLTIFVQSIAALCWWRRGRNILKILEKSTIFNENPVQQWSCNNFRAF